MLQKNCFMVFERYIPELKKYDSISFLHQPMTSGQPLKVVQRHMAHPVMSPSEDVKFSNVRGLYLRKYGKYIIAKGQEISEAIFLAILPIS